MWAKNSSRVRVANQGCQRRCSSTVLTARARRSWPANSSVSLGRVNTRRVTLSHSCSGALGRGWCGQASKASQIGQVAQFAAAGKNIGKKSLAEMAMAYGYVYVAQVAMGADQNQTLKAIVEAESYPGPSIVIAYSPCEMHGIKGGMVNCQSEMKKAVQAGYWFNFRFDPRKKAEGANPFVMDSKEPTGDYLEFIGGETRYSRLERSFPDRAKALFGEAVDQSKDRYEYLLRLSNLYAPKQES